MPGIGSPRVTFRMSQADIDLVNQFIKELNDNRPRRKENWGTFVRKAIDERIAKIRRGRKKAGPDQPGIDQVNDQQPAELPEEESIFEQNGGER